MSAPGEMARFAEQARAAILGGGTALPQGLTARDPAQVARRFAVHRNNVTVALVEALATRFPVVRRLVGDAFFRGAARVFVARSPPLSPIMTFYGDAFPDFLAGFPPAAALPWLADVSRLEAARTHAYHAADARPLAAADLAAVAERDPERWGLALHPALRIVASAHPIVAIWAMNQPGATPGPLASRDGETALVTRPDLDVRVAPAEPGEAAFLAASGRGESYADAVAAALVASAAFDPARALARGLAHGLFAGVTPLETETEEPS
ncbi:HvfC/BufC family peptide modification chaperone [Salinarimonas chemoclinalis]|uniref:HvfC/BufC family peptide modification chaperone n=1 Tax=Salinarimonas chemoclinalis TaxID=3241599 RepID=UPI0035586532